MAALDLDHVSKTFGATKVIHDVSLRVEHGQFCVFVGPSGCGKSTLLRMIAGLEPISGGEVRIDDDRVNDLGAAQRGLAMVFQSYALYPHMSVRQNLAFGLENVNTPRDEIESRIKEAARMLQIEPLLARKPRQLSGGQRQRIAIGRAVVREPRIFLFDEPLSNLDAELRVQMRAEITGLHGRLGNTMIYVTHDQVEAMTMADRIAVLRQGNLEQLGAPLELYNEPSNRFVAGFIGSPRMNFLGGRIARADRSGALVELEQGATVEVTLDAASVRQGDPVTLGIRPEHIHLDEASGLRFRVLLTEQLGSTSFLHLDDGRGGRLVVQEAGQTGIERDQEVGLALPPRACHLFRADSGERALPRRQGGGSGALPAAAA